MEEEPIGGHSLHEVHSLGAEVAVVAGVSAWSLEPKGGCGGFHPTPRCLGSEGSATGWLSMPRSGYIKKGGRGSNRQNIKMTFKAVKATICSVSASIAQSRCPPPRLSHSNCVFS